VRFTGDVERSAGDRFTDCRYRFTRVHARVLNSYVTDLEYAAVSDDGVDILLRGYDLDPVLVPRDERGRIGLDMTFESVENVYNHVNLMT